ncbi:MAG: cupin domain-containing protein [Bryobacteraceae bacterium]
MKTAHLVNKGMYGALDLFGPTVEFLTSPEDPDAVYCVMRGTIPAGASVPLHSHADVESFYLLSGTVQVLSQRGEKLEWLDAKQGDFVQVPGGAKHAFRNTSREPVVQLLITTPRLGRFFQEIGRPVTGGASTPPAPDELQHFMRVAARYGHWLGSPEENAALGISLF